MYLCLLRKVLFQDADTITGQEMFQITQCGHALNGLFLQVQRCTLFHNMHVQTLTLVSVLHNVVKEMYSLYSIEEID